jgi:putative membrane protein
VRTAARSTFVEKGISKTKRRSGVLVYLSRFEEDAVVVLDVGLDEARLGAKYTQAVAKLRRAVPLHDVDALVVGLEAIGAALAKEYPVTEDDEDELSNEVAA